MTSKPYIAYMTTNGLGNAWVGNEIGVVAGEGIPVRLYTMRKERLEFFRSDWAERLHEDTAALYPVRVPAVAAAVLLAPFRFGGRFFAALGNALFGRREHARARLAGLSHLFIACEWAAALRRDPPAYIHSQWIHSCGTIAMYGSWLLGVPFGFTGHAADLFRERCALNDKIDRAVFIVCISEFHRRFFLDEGADPRKLQIVYCGIDVRQFAPPSAPEHRPVGSPLRIRSTGRLVEKKGFDDLIAACGILRDHGVAFECVIGGSGPLLGELRQQINAHSLGDRVRVTGEALKQEDITAFMHGGDVYCLPCKPAPDGDIDGLPQMLMEAMACGLPAVSTDLVGIPDLIEDGVTGLLTQHSRPEQVAAALERLAGDPELRRTLAESGRRRVLERFEIVGALRPLLAHYRRMLGVHDAEGATPGTNAERKSA
jgi:glycosyltransferase involved in cell wall biosynthesis